MKFRSEIFNQVEYFANLKFHAPFNEFLSHLKGSSYSVTDLRAFNSGTIVSINKIQEGKIFHRQKFCVNVCEVSMYTLKVIFEATWMQIFVKKIFD